MALTAPPFPLSAALKRSAPGAPSSAPAVLAQSPTCGTKRYKKRTHCTATSVVIGAAWLISWGTVNLG